MIRFFYVYLIGAVLFFKMPKGVRYAALTPFPDSSSIFGNLKILEIVF